MKHTILVAALGSALIVVTPIFLQSSSQAGAQDQGRLPAPPALVGMGLPGAMPESG